MKQFVKFVMALLAVIFSANITSAQIIGKTYQPGDTIFLDGISCLVYKVDESGMHGTAMSPIVFTAKEKEKYKKQGIKYIEKEIKKGKATKDDLDMWIANCNAADQLPVILKEKGKKGTIFRVDTWYDSAPEGWRIPTSADAEDFATFYCGGIGKDNGIKLKFLMKANELTSDMVAKSNLLSVAFYGFILADSKSPSDVKFLSRMWQKLTTKEWFEIKDKFVGKERTVAVKDF